MFLKFLAIFGTIISGSSKCFNNHCRENKIYTEPLLSNHINELCDSNLIANELCYNLENQTNVYNKLNIENYDSILTINYIFSNYIKNLVYICMIFFTSICISCFIVSYFLYSNMITNNKYLYQENLDNDHKDFFEFKYIEEYDDLSNNKITNEKYDKINNKYVKETTPVGDIFMSYDKDEGAFIYYCKTSTIRYKYLDSVARLFVIKFDCKKLYYHLHDQLIKSFEKLDNIELERDNDSEQEKDNDSEQEKDNDSEQERDDEKDDKLKLDFKDIRYSNTSSDNEDVFVNLKSYNTNNNKSGKNKFDKKCNKFIYKGNIDDFYKIYNVTNDEKDIDIYNVECSIINNSKSLKNISFKEFKKII